MKALIFLSSLMVLNLNAATLSIAWSLKNESNKHVVQFSCKIQDNGVISLNDANVGVERTTIYDNSFFQKELKELRLSEKDNILALSDSELKHGMNSAKYKVGNTIVKHDLYNLNGRSKKIIVKKEIKDTKILRMFTEAEKMCFRLL